MAIATCKDNTVSAELAQPTAHRAPVAIPNRGDRTLVLAVLAGALLAGWALRVYRLDAQSLWYDEGTTAALVQRSLGQITRDAALDIHPPLYYYVLHFWVELAGRTEFALRLPSALFGVATIALTAQIGRHLFGNKVGTLAAVLSLAAPILVYYSQEARMYAQVTMLAGLSTYLLLRLVDRPSSGRGLWLAYGLATAAMLYSHYYAFTIVLAQDACCLVELVASRRDPSRAAAVKRIVLAQLGAALLFIPWLAVSYGQLASWPAISPALSFGELARRVLRAFTFGIGWPASYTPRRELAVLAVLLAGAIAARWRKRQAAFMACLTLVPVLAMYALSLQRPMYNPKFLLPAAPVFMLCAAASIAALAGAVRRVWRALAAGPAAFSVGLATLALGAASFLYPAAASLQAYYFDPTYARDDYRGLAQFVAEAAAPGDALILEAPGQTEIFGYYFRGALPQYPLPRQRPIDEAATTAELEAIAERHGRAWVVLWAVEEADPDGLLESWLAGRASAAMERDFGAVRLVRYDFRPRGTS